MVSFGLDVSHYQGHINWEKVADAGKTFVIIKAQYESGTHKKDEFFEANYNGSGEHGLNRGVYIYIGSNSAADPERDALSLLKHLNHRELESGIWLDCEDPKLKSYGKAKWTKLINQYASIFQAAGYYVGIYCSRDWYCHVLDYKTLAQNYEFWIARYPKIDTGIYSPASILTPQKYACAWQYSSKGRVNGIVGNVDLNVDFDGITDLSAKHVREGVADTKNPYREPTGLVRLGTRGNTVKWVQWMLNRVGYVLPVNGIADELTIGAVMDFQKKNDLTIDGIVGKKTVAKLKM